MGRARHRQRGGMTVMGIGAVLICVLLLGFGVNFGFWSYKKAVAADAAEALARAAIKNQLTYRKLGNPDTRAMTGAMVTEMELVERLHGLDIGIEFGLDDGSGFVAVGEEDPDPETTEFNGVRVQLCTPLDDVTGSFSIGGREACVLAEAQFDVSQDCYCNHVVCPAGNFSGPLGGLARGLCMLGCTVGSALRAVLNLLFSLDVGQLVLALDCVLESLVISLDTTLGWVLGPDAIHLEYRRYT